MATTIQVSEQLVQELKKRKLYDQETYEEVITNLIEDTLELSQETKRNIEISRKEIKAGKVRTLAEVKKELGLNV